MKDENELDQFFRKGLSEPDIPFNELDWEKMEKKLASAKSKRILLLWPIAAAGIAASVILMMFILFKGNPTIPVDTIRTTRSKTVMPSIESLNSEILRKPKAPIHQNRNVIKKSVSVANLSAEAKLVEIPSPQSSNAITTFKSDIALLPDTTGQTARPEVVAKASLVNTINTTSNGKANLGGRLAFSIIAAPDISSSPANLGTKVSTNVGLLATYSLTKKLSLTTGVIYARKLYDYGGASVAAYGGSGKAMETYADCKVLDIPLNLNYRVYSKGQNSISLNSGLSSYLMLNERYKYISNDELGNTKTSVINIVNQNQHLFGVANVAVSFNRKINSQLSIGIQPFIKIPLTGIGYHDTRLQSKGVAFSLDLNMGRH